MSLCRDCGRVGDESPDDPAPNLCPPCYGARLERVSVAFTDLCDREPPVTSREMVDWLIDALQRVGGETPEFAHKHAQTLFAAVVLSYAPN